MESPTTEKPKAKPIASAKTKSTAEALKLSTTPDLTGESLSTPVETLGAIYKLMVDMSSEKSLQNEKEDSLVDTLRKKYASRQEELMSVLSSSGVKVPKQEDPIEQSDKTSKKLKKIKAPKTGKKTTSKKLKVETPEMPKPDTASKQSPAASALSGFGGGMAAAAVVGGAMAVTASSSLAGAITKGESYGGDPNAYNVKTGEKKYTPGRGDTPVGKKITDMTVGEIKEAQSRGELHAVGKWQMIPSTFKDAIEKTKTSESQKFDEATQDKMFQYFLSQKRPVIGQYLKGDPNVSRDDAVTEVAKEWASVGVPKDMQGKHGPVKKGQSYYEGDGINHASTSPDLIGKLLDESRVGGPAPLTPPPVPGLLGTMLDTSSKDNLRMHDDLNKSSMSSPTINNNTVNNAQTTQMANRKVEDDRSAYERKSSIR